MTQLYDYQITVFSCFIELGVWHFDFGHNSFEIFCYVDTIGM